MNHNATVRSLVRRRIAPALAFTALLSISMTAVSAQAAGNGNGPSPNPLLKSPVAPSNFRAQLQGFDEQMATIGKDNPGLDKKWNITGSANLSEQALAQANDVELNAVYQVVSNIPNWQAVPGQVRTRTQLLARVKHTRNHFQSKAIVMGDTCTENGTSYPDPGLSTVIGFQDAAAVGDMALQILPDSDVYGLIVAGEGAVVTSPISIERGLIQAVTVGLDVDALANQNMEDLFQQCSSDAQAVEQDTIKSDIETTVENDLATITTNLADDTTAIRGDISSLKADLDSSVSTIENTLGTISGKVDAVAHQVTGVQTTVDTNLEQRQLRLSVLSLTNGNRLLVSTTEGGMPVTARLTSLKLATDNSSAPVFSDFTSKVTQTNPVNGVLQITFPSNQPATTIYLIQAQATESIQTGGQTVSKTYSGTILKELGQ